MKICLEKLRTRYQFRFTDSCDLTHLGQVTHICVSKQTNNGSDNGLSPGPRQVIIWPHAGILLIRTLGANFSEILGDIHSFSFSKMHLNMLNMLHSFTGCHVSSCWIIIVPRDMFNRKMPFYEVHKSIWNCQQRATSEWIQFIYRTDSTWNYRMWSTGYVFGVFALHTCLMRRSSRSDYIMKNCL